MSWALSHASFIVLVIAAFTDQRPVVRVQVFRGLEALRLCNLILIDAATFGALFFAT